MDRKKYEIKYPKSLNRHFLNKCLNIVSRIMIAPTVRISLYRLMGITIGRNVFIGLDVYFDDTFPELINIEDKVVIAHRVLIIAHDDSYQREVGKVCIKKNVYIGAGAIILMGVTIGENSIIGAGAVVTKDIPANSVAVGSPARVIKSGRENIE